MRPNTTRLGLLAVFIAGALLSCSRPANQALLSLRIAERPASDVPATIRFSSLPENPIVVIKQSAGFASWEGALSAYQEIEIEIELSTADGSTRSYRIGRSFSSNSGIYSSRREDGTVDFGGRLILDKVASGQMKMKINDSKNLLHYPLTIQVQKLRETPF